MKIKLESMVDVNAYHRERDTRWVVNDSAIGLTIGKKDQGEEHAEICNLHDLRIVQQALIGTDWHIKVVV